MSGFEINQLTITGNLTQDPDLRSLQSGQKLCRLRIAHNDRRKNASGEWLDQAAFYDVTAWGGFGEWIAGNLTKGAKVVVSGRLRWREYETDGAKRQAIDIIATSVVPVPKSTTSTAGDAPAPDASEEEDIAF